VPVSGRGHFAVWHPESDRRRRSHRWRLSIRRFRLYGRTQGCRYLAV